MLERFRAEMDAGPLLKNMPQNKELERRSDIVRSLNAKKRAKLGLVLVSALAIPVLAFPALAHGPSRQKVSETIEINATAAKVWAIIGNFQEMKWHPAVQKTEGRGGNAPEATRKLTLGPNATIDEQLAKYSAETMSYSYTITAVDVKILPVTNYS